MEKEKLYELCGKIADPNLSTVLFHILSKLDTLSAPTKTVNEELQEQWETNTPGDIYPGDPVRWWEPGEEDHGEMQSIIDIVLDHSADGGFTFRVTGYENQTWDIGELNFEEGKYGWLLEEDWEVKESERLDTKIFSEPEPFDEKVIQHDQKVMESEEYRKNRNTQFYKSMLDLETRKLEEEEEEEEEEEDELQRLHALVVEQLELERKLRTKAEMKILHLYEVLKHRGCSDSGGCYWYCNAGPGRPLEVCPAKDGVYCSIFKEKP